MIPELILFIWGISLSAVILIVVRQKEKAQKHADRNKCIAKEALEELAKPKPAKIEYLPIKAVDEDLPYWERLASINDMEEWRYFIHKIEQEALLQATSMGECTAEKTAYLAGIRRVKAEVINTVLKYREAIQEAEALNGRE